MTMTENRGRNVTGVVFAWVLLELGSPPAIKSSSEQSGSGCIVGI